MLAKIVSICTIVAAVVGVVVGLAQLYIWHKDGTLTVNGLAVFGVISLLVFISSLLQLWAAKSRLAAEGPADANPQEEASFDGAELADLRTQIDKLSTFETIAVKQVIVKRGMTGFHFAEFILSQHGFPVAIRTDETAIREVFQRVAAKTSFLDHDRGTGRWFVKTESFEQVRFLLRRMPTDLGGL